MTNQFSFEGSVDNNGNANINAKMLIESENMLMNLADDMAAAATSFNGHGYQVFISSREQFRQTLHEILLNCKKR